MDAPAQVDSTPPALVEPAPERHAGAEFKSGANRWRDTGVYVDGKFVGLLQWAELPVALEPIWIKVKASAPKRYGTSDTGWRWARERRYRFTDYLRAIGVDLRKVDEVHVYGPRFTQTIVATGADLRSKAADGFMFRFGRITAGKAIPVVPHDFGNGVRPDKISAVMVYVDKAPPVHDRRLGLVLDGEVQDGVPYFGPPLRGGVRVYLDDRFAAYIKRQNLPLDTRRDGLGWHLFDYLAQRGVDTSSVAEAWVVRDERWQERLNRDQLESLWFLATPEAKGHIELGDQRLKASALILRSQPLAQADRPAPDADEL